MKVVKAAQKEQTEILDRIEAQIAYYDDILRFEEGGDITEKKTLKFHRDMLYQEIWDISLSKVAKKYDIPYAKLREACVEANIPLPTQSYWGNLQVGKTVQKTPLPESSENELTVEFSYREKLVELASLHDAPQNMSDSNTTVQPIGQSQSSEPEAAITIPTTKFDFLDFLPENEIDQVVSAALSLQVDPKMNTLHPVLQRHRAAFHAWSKQHPRDPYANWNRDPYRAKAENEPPLWESVTEERLPRVYRFLDSLYRAIEKLGGKIFDDLSLQVRNEHVNLKITEGRDQTAHVLTKDEQRQLDKYELDKQRYHYAYEPKFRKFDYIPNGKLRISAYGDSFVRDTTNTGVESRIGDILLALYRQSEDVRIEREKREEAQRKAEEEKRQKEFRRKLYNEEVDKLQELNNKALDFETACRIRAYIAAVASKPDLDAEIKEWIVWAKAKADWYDPTVSAADPLFGERKHSADSKDKEPVKQGPYYW